jgi:ABC-type glycerol-3-phosphate transport system permease component
MSAGAKTLGAARGPDWPKHLVLAVLLAIELFTLGVGLIYLDDEYVKEWGQVMAAYRTAALPLLVLFVFTMRLFVRSISQGAQGLNWKSGAALILAPTI